MARNVVGHQTEPVFGRELAVLEAVSAAVQDRRVLRFDYGGEWTTPPKRVEPHAIVARHGRWYLVGWDLEKTGWRTYRLDRMTPKSPGGPRFTPRPIPTGEAGTFLAARFKGAEHTNGWPCQAELLLELPAAKIAPWLGDGDLEQVSDTSCRVRVGSWSWAGVLAWVLRFEAPFTILGPEALRASVAGFTDRLTEAAAAPTA